MAPIPLSALTNAKFDGFMLLAVVFVIVALLCLSKRHWTDSLYVRVCSCATFIRHSLVLKTVSPHLPTHITGSEMTQTTAGSFIACAVLPGLLSARVVVLPDPASKPTSTTSVVSSTTRARSTFTPRLASIKELDEEEAEIFTYTAIFCHRILYAIEELDEEELPVKVPKNIPEHVVASKIVLATPALSISKANLPFDESIVAPNADIKIVPPPVDDIFLVDSRNAPTFILSWTICEQNDYTPPRFTPAEKGKGRALAEFDDTDKENSSFTPTKKRSSRQKRSSTHVSPSTPISSHKTQSYWSPETPPRSRHVMTSYWSPDSPPQTSLFSTVFGTPSRAKKTIARKETAELADDEEKTPVARKKTPKRMQAKVVEAFDDDKTPKPLKKRTSTPKKNQDSFSRSPPPQPHFLSTFLLTRTPSTTNTNIRA